MATFDNPATFTSSVSILGTFNSPQTWNGEVPSTAMPTRTTQIDGIPLTSLRVHDAPQTNLPGTSATDDLGLYGATFGTPNNAMYIGTGDVKTTSVTRYARFCYYLPSDYKAGSPVTVRCYAGMKTAAADGSATLDVECYECAGDQSIGSDLCTTSAMTINSTSFANKDFTITPSGLVAGDLLDLRLTVAIVDTAGASAVDATIGKIQMLISKQ